MAYGDVGGPNLDFSNMGCMGFCPEMFSIIRRLLLRVLLLCAPILQLGDQHDQI